MKSMLKLILVAIPALVLAATVGLTTMGCDDDTGATTAPPDLTTVVPRDMTATGG